eukprot:TRINITY_DN4897_c1_g1_i1.p1 TRINITY_DN4897_c1_g1~~TRINITY_DN4897_c1_g1_i1.p1  ORF type:complete len:183 (+),score=19.85 TRINITY_DN4897_c1_g1_i1:41-550(+)
MGWNSLIPVLYSAQNLTSLEYLSHSILVLAWRSVTYLVILASVVLECLSIGRNLVTLWEEFGFCDSIGLKDFNLSCNILLEIHGSGNSVLREHASGCSLDVIKFSSGRLHPAINCHQGVIKASKRSNKFFNFGDSLFEASRNLKFSSTAFISLVRIFFLSSGMVIAMQL